MNPKSRFLLIATIPFAAAVPFSQQTPDPTPTTQVVDPALSSMIAAKASASSANNTCPPSHRSKQCCESVNSITDDITKPLGDAIPLLEGTTFSSLLGLDCLAMADSDPIESCRQDVMCCDGQPGKNAQGGDLLKECVPFDEAVAAKQKALDENKEKPVQAAMSYVALTSSLAAASSSARLVSRPVLAVPTVSAE
ncbi:hypothetical protein BDV28DRAFT_24149 [Aspergillus coremiiformis]|uniref:Hydrophobin n=1 Tax=Aspergillus coremiiformis TaxID=138285 RepID=A0A5N6ZEZ3_9EURO|nr:hypothetical protein BDV28DRAFT_24149 [Aspergillus coremiiformis]